MHSTKLALEGCHNTRDLGGLSADGGRAIRRGRLLRSDFLWKATESDERLLVSLGLRYIADFRNRREHDEAPDRPISGATALHLPVLPERADGITHEQEDPLQRIRRQNGELIEAGIDARESMRGLYRRMLQSDCALTAYRTFMQTLLQSGGATVLWHCSAGKDRAGVGSMLVEKALGVSDADIREDYLATNDCVWPAVSRDMEELRRMGAREDELETFRIYRMVDPSFFDTAMEELQPYGGLDGYLRLMGIGDAEREQLRADYLD